MFAGLVFSLKKIRVKNQKAHVQILKCLKQTNSMKNENTHWRPITPGKSFIWIQGKYTDPNSLKATASVTKRNYKAEQCVDINTKPNQKHIITLSSTHCKVQ